MQFGLLWRAWLFPGDVQKENLDGEIHNWDAPAFCSRGIQNVIEWFNLNQQGQQTWLTVYRMLVSTTFANPWDVYPPEVIEILRIRLQDQNTQHWCSLLQATAGKLQTYKQFKRNLTFEPWLHLPPYLRRPLTRHRICAHPLSIETGRYHHPSSLPAEQKECPFCQGQVEDEIHFLLECEHYETQRTSQFSP